jgi:CHAT domain-containing protein
MQDWQLSADLVVLSACQTGVSRVLRGDEPMGLIRAFLTAGAKAVIVSRWAVEDLPTFLLMSYFYWLLSESPGLDLSQALYHTRRWLRRATAAELREFAAGLPVENGRVELTAQLVALPSETRPYQEPRYWAAFMLIGGI